MIYLDTNVIISYVDELDANHSRAVKLLDSLKDDKVISKLTLVELASVYSRAGLEEPQALAVYSVCRSGARVVEVDFNDVMTQAFKYAQALGLRSLDLLHVIACKLAGAKRLATFDEDIRSRADEISGLGVEVIP